VLEDLSEDFRGKHNGVEILGERFHALAYAITACKAMEIAGEVLPEKKPTTPDVYKCPDCGQFMLSESFGYNQAIDEVRPAFGRILHENNELKETIKDARIDIFAKQKAKITELEDQAEISNKIISNYYDEFKDLKAECERLRGELCPANPDDKPACQSDLDECERQCHDNDTCVTPVETIKKFSEKEITGMTYGEAILAVKTNEIINNLTRKE